MGEIHELFVLALSLVWFAGATPEATPRVENPQIFRWKMPCAVFRSGSGVSESKTVGHLVSERNQRRSLTVLPERTLAPSTPMQTRFGLPQRQWGCVKLRGVLRHRTST